MELTEASPEQKDEYNNFVATSQSGSFLQSWEWGQWQELLGRSVHRFWIKDENREIVGAAQFIQMPLPFGQFYLYAPYGPVLAGSENFQFPISNFQSIFNELKPKFPNAVFIRIEPKDASLVTSHLSLATKSTNIQPGRTLIIDLEKPLEQLLAEMHHKTRYNIKLAEKHGVEIKEELDISIGHGLYFKEAIDLICQTAKRQGYSGYGADYYNNLVDFFALNSRSEVKAHIYKAIFQNQLLAAAIMVDFGKTRTFLFGGSSEFHKNVMAPYLLHWQAMKDAKAACLRVYDFWGVETSSGDTPGFVRFKLGFGGSQKEYPGAYDLAQNSPSYKIYTFLRKIKKTFLH